MNESNSIKQIYRKLGPDSQTLESRRLYRLIPQELSELIDEIESVYCYNIELENESTSIEEAQLHIILWILQETFEPHLTNLQHNDLELSENELQIEIGPRLAFCTAWCSNCLSMLRACGVTCIKRIEKSTRHKIRFKATNIPTSQQKALIEASLFDCMTQCIYPEPLRSFATYSLPQPTQTFDVLSEGRQALCTANALLGLGLDGWDLDYNTNMFTHALSRNPTDVELFDIGQSNSEHSRHWYFGGQLTLDGTPQPHSLFQAIKATLPQGQPSNSIIAFHDNSSALRGCEASVLHSADPTTAARMTESVRLLHPTLTAETHNFPTGVAPFAGAETGTGGRLRDNQATGRGAHTLAGICGYCVGNLHIPELRLPWEQPLQQFTSSLLKHATSLQDIAAHLPTEGSPGKAGSEKVYQHPVAYPAHLATPLSIIVEASNGASDYGNKYGEPVVCGFARSFGLQVPCLQPAATVRSIPADASGSSSGSSMRVEWLKPVMFTAGVGWLDDAHKDKGAAAVDMLVCKMGGPAYRIGMGGGAASSRVHITRQVDTTTTAVDESVLDYDAVQRGDAEMENRMNRLVRGCIELQERNPLISIHDQGAGGNGNVLKELADPLGARIKLDSIPLGDPTLSAKEIWGAEYQENNAFLALPGEQGFDLIERIAQRENCPVAVVGTVTGDGRIIAEAADGSLPVDLPLSLVLGKMPAKEYHLTSAASAASTLSLSVQEAAFPAALSWVLRLLDVGSKRFLTNKVDRSVTGLVAQQQCVGPLHIPLADVAVLAQSYFAKTGVAVAVGEQPLKGLVDSAAQARMTVCEALSNLVFADITSLQDVKASCNWMWPAKLAEPNTGLNMEGARMYTACCAVRDCMVRLGAGIDGGKDSLTMTAKVGEEVVRGLGQVVLTCYAPCRYITHTLTPDLKHPGEGVLVYIDLGEGMYRLGGSALSTVHQQVGGACPDMSPSALDTFRRCWECLQSCLRLGWIQSGHDRSDGGLVTTVLEMAFAGNVGIEVTLQESWLRNSSSSSSGGGAAIGGSSPVHAYPHLALGFAEECGFVLEVLEQDLSQLLDVFTAAAVPVCVLGKVVAQQTLLIECTQLSGERTVLLSGAMSYWRDIWESTSFALERRQCNPVCVQQEQEGLSQRRTPPYQLTFTPTPTVPRGMSDRTYRVAVLRQEGTNGDREMAAAFHTVGFEAWDVNMTDLLSARITLDRFHGIAFCGGFSYADVNDSAKGWAGVIKFHPTLLQQFAAFRQRSDTFSLGVCNGAQLMALLGWVPFEDGRIPHQVHTAVDSLDQHLSGSKHSLLGDKEEEQTHQHQREQQEDVMLPEQQPRFVHNTSGRFESRWSTVTVLPSPAVLLRGMEGSTLGIWSAHGEGRAHFPSAQHLTYTHSLHLAPLRYVDDDNAITESYPLNPNGSPAGIAALCSTNGRHLAIMPHPERSFLQWQLPFLTPTDKAICENTAPWLRLFQNALHFCENQSVETDA